MKKKELSHKEIARLGGLARAKNLGVERRHEIASLGGQTAAKNRKLKNGKKRPSKT